MSSWDITKRVIAYSVLGLAVVSVTTQVVADGTSLGTYIGDIRAGFKGGSLSGPVILPDNIEIVFGTGSDHNITHDPNALEINSSDCDGAGADCVLLSNTNGADDICMPNDGQQWQLGAACGTDAAIDWDGDSLDFATAAAEFTGTVLSTGNLTCSAQADIEGYAAIGNGSALDAKATLLVDRDFSSATTASQVSVTGTATITGGTSSIDAVSIAPSGVVLNDGGPGAHARVSSLYVSEPVVTETVGTATETSVLYLDAAATEGDTNWSLHSVGAVKADSTLDADGAMCLSTDSVALSLGEDCATDSTIQFNGTDVLLGSSGDFVFNASPRVGSLEVEPDNGATTILDMQVSGTPSDGDEQSFSFSLDSNANATFKIYSEADGAGAVDSFDLVVPSYEVDYVLPAASAALGPTAPAVGQVNDSCAGRGFDAAAETAIITFEIPSCYADGNSDDLALKIYWCGTHGDVIGNTEDVDWDITYRSMTWGIGNDDADTGSAVSATTTYTQSGAGEDDDLHESSITLDADSGDQPLNAGDVLSITFNRDTASESNSYSGNAIVQLWELVVPQTSLLCDHEN